MFQRIQFNLLILFTPIAMLAFGNTIVAQTEEKEQTTKSGKSGNIPAQSTKKLGETEQTDKAVLPEESEKERLARLRQAALVVSLQKKTAFLRKRLQQNLKYYFLQKENSTVRSSWGVMHAMISYGPYAEMYGDGKVVTNVDWLCQNGKCRGMQLMRLENNRLATNNGPGRQGHDGQFLAILAQSQIPRTQTLTVEGRKFTIDDLIEYEKRTCKPKSELTFKLIGLSHYLDSDEVWKADDGSSWDLERVLAEELKQPINGVACGGTHRIMGYSYSLLMRKLQGKPIKGEWRRADNFVREFRDYTFSLQNADGSFSTEWFRQRGARHDSQRRVQTTGHILEWMVFSSSLEELSDQRLIRAVNYLSDLLWNERKTKWAVGPKGHAIRALRLYYERVFVQPTQTANQLKINPRLFR